LYISFVGSFQLGLFCELSEYNGCALTTGSRKASRVHQCSREGNRNRAGYAAGRMF